MAINKNHEFEDLNGIKCAVVEKNATQERVDFVKRLLEYNRYTVVVTGSPAPKPLPVSAATEPAATLPATFTIGVTDVMFNATNAIFGRSLRTRDGNIVTLAYWQQKEQQPNDDIPYFENGVGNPDK